MNTRTHIALVLGLAGLTTLSGCGVFGQHSKHTAAGIKMATAKINGIKAGVEWEAAERQFLAGDLDKALQTVDRTIAMNDKVAKSHVLKGRILMEMGKFEEAIESLRTASNLNPENVDAQYFLGIIAERQSRFAEAADRYMRAMQLDPNNAQYVIACSEMLIQSGRNAEGEALLREKAEQFNCNAGIRHALGQFEMSRSNFREAVAMYTQARLLAPDDLIILEDLTRAQIAARQYGEAESNLRTLTAAPDNAERSDLQILRVRCLAAMDRLADARAMMSTIVANPKHGSDVSAWIMYGNICARLEDPARLRQAVSRILSLAPDRPEGYSLRAMQMRMTNQPDTALTAINQAITLNPNDPEQWVIRALIQAEGGEFTDSQRSLKSALKLDPRNANANQMMEVVTALAKTQPQSETVVVPVK